VEVHGEERRVPVVGVDDVGREAEELAAADDGPGEEGESLDAVVVAVETRRVDVLAIEEVVIGYKDQRNVGAGDGGPKVRYLGIPVRPSH